MVRDKRKNEKNHKRKNERKNEKNHKRKNKRKNERNHKRKNKRKKVFKLYIYMIINKTLKKIKKPKKIKTKKIKKKKRKFTSKKYPYKNHSKEKALDNFLKLKAKKDLK